MAVFMQETLRLSKTLKSSRDDFGVLDNFNVSSIKTAFLSLFYHIKLASELILIVYCLP